METGRHSDAPKKGLYSIDKMTIDGLAQAILRACDGHREGTSLAAGTRSVTIKIPVKTEGNLPLRGAVQIFSDDGNIEIGKQSAGHDTRFSINGEEVVFQYDRNNRHVEA